MTATSHNPRTGEVVASEPETTGDELSNVVGRAASAAPVLAATSPAQRQVWLNAIADELEAHSEELVSIADQETALGVPRLASEVSRAAAQLRFYAAVAVEGSFIDATVDPATEVTQRLVRVNRPLGPVAVFGASNFPFAFSVLGNDTGAALAAGCPVIAKAHDAHLALSTRQAELARSALRNAGAPNGTFDMVVGFETGANLVTEPEITAVAFTGSQAGGLALWKLANSRETVIPVFAEMGTVNPVVVTRAASTQIPKIARGFVDSFTLGHGQFCTKPGLILAPKGSDAATHVAQALEQAAPRPVMLTQAMSHAVINGLRQLQYAGAQLVTHVAAGPEAWAAPAAVLRVRPSAFRHGSRLLEECFGAVALVCEYDSDDQLSDLLATLQPSLAATLMVSDSNDPQGLPLMQALSGKAGRVTVNDWPTGVAFAWAQQHGGPWPSTTMPSATSVGAGGLNRFVRPIAYQSAPDSWLPPEARSSNPWRLPRRVAGRLVDPVG